MPGKIPVWLARFRRLFLGPGFWEWKSLGILSLLLVVLLVQETATQSASPAAAEAIPAGAIPTEEFSRLVREFSEEEGYFFSDNFISNETAYLLVVDTLQKLEVSGGAYLGVGPEQNFTYIAKIRPQIAFIVDIRRQAIIQHLLYKSLFHLARNRVQFLSLLLSKPLPTGAAAKEGSLDQMVEYFSREPYRQKLLAENLERVRRTIEQNFRLPLSESDLRTLEHVYSAFAEGGLYISFRFGPWSQGWGFPNLRDLILAEDLKGERGNFLAREEDYQFLRRLHRQNRIIPVVGDFAGGKALSDVANYLRKNHYTVSAFYTSNVEQFLFADEVFERFTQNVQRLPITHKSVFIRSVRSGWMRHPAQVPGHRATTLLQKISVFLKDYDDGLYLSYRDLITTHYISPLEP